MSVAQKTPGIYRLVSPALATGVKTGSLNDNITFNTNIPFTSLAMRIWAVKYFPTDSATAGFASNSNYCRQLFMQLTENQTKTSVVTTDSSYLDEAEVQESVDNSEASAVGAESTPIRQLEIYHQFHPMTTPWSVATKLNFVVTMVNTGANTYPVGIIFKPFVTIEYTLETLTPDLSAYLSRRLQIQGS